MIAAAEVQFAKLGALGISFLASTGDYGAPGTSQHTFHAKKITFFSFCTEGQPDLSDNCPLDTSKYCFSGGCNYTNTMCGSFVMTIGSTSCYWPMGLSGQSCNAVLNTISSIPLTLAVRSPYSLSVFFFFI